MTIEYWSAALPRIAAEEVEARRRWLPAAERLRAWGPAVGLYLPDALAEWWPFAGSDARVLKLHLEDPESGGREIVLDHFPVRIGRGESCALQLPHAAVSTEHAELQVERGVVCVIDLRSTNGTRRNGEVLPVLSPVPVSPGDQLQLGPFVLTLLGFEAPPPEENVAAFRATPLQPRGDSDPFAALSHPTDRWLRVQWAGETGWVRVPAPWIRACWRRAAEVVQDDAGEIDPMEEGVAQFVLYQVARGLGERLRQPVEVGGWMTPPEARSAAADGDWLHSDVWISSPTAEIPTSLLFPVREGPAAAGPRWDDLAWPARVCLGLIRLKVSEWRQVEPGDALLPDVFWPTAWLGGGKAGVDMGPAYVRVSRFWHAGRLLRSDAGAKLRLEKLWLPTPGGDWLMPDEDALPSEAQSLSVQDLELQVVIELERFPATVGEIQRWRDGEILTLPHGPSDPVRLVVETGMQRRVLGEGRVVLVNGKLGIEILRILTQLQDTRPEPA
jgi:flagellar motor switch/type III secretory pathway protein FliN